MRIRNGRSGRCLILKFTVALIMSKDIRAISEACLSPIFYRYMKVFSGKVTTIMISAHCPCSYFRYSRWHHVSVPDCFDLIHFIFCNNCVKRGVEIVQHVDNLKATSCYVTIEISWFSNLTSSGLLWSDMVVNPHMSLKYIVLWSKLSGSTHSFAINLLATELQLI